MTAMHDNTIRVQGVRDADLQPAGVALFEVSDLPARVKRIVTTDEGRLQILLESESLSEESIEKTKNLLQLQQDAVFVTVRAAQQDLFQ